MAGELNILNEALEDIQEGIIARGARRATGAVKDIAKNVASLGIRSKMLKQGHADQIKAIDKNIVEYKRERTAKAEKAIKKLNLKYGKKIQMANKEGRDKHVLSLKSTLKLKTLEVMQNAKRDIGAYEERMDDKIRELQGLVKAARQKYAAEGDYDD
jgi:hypothetical protein